jgi:hypothetical protein
MTVLVLAAKMAQRLFLVAVAVAQAGFGLSLDSLPSNAHAQHVRVQAKRSLTRVSRVTALAGVKKKKRWQLIFRQVLKMAHVSVFPAKEKRVFVAPQVAIFIYS